MDLMAPFDLERVSMIATRKIIVPIEYLIGTTGRGRRGINKSIQLEKIWFIFGAVSILGGRGTRLV